MKHLMIVAVMLLCITPMYADDSYKTSPEYLALRDSMHHAFNSGDSLRFYPALKNLQDYLLEQNDKQQIEIERGKLNVAILKQMNNRSRLLLDAAKYELKRAEAERQVRETES